MTARSLKLVLVSLCVCAVASQEIAESIRKCRHAGDAFNQCLINVIKELQPRLARGLPELNLPAMEPVILRNIDFSHSNPPVTINATFSNVKVYGLTSFKINHLNVEAQNDRSVSLRLSIPKLHVKGHYKLTGNIFVLPIEGEGDINMRLENMTGTATGNLIRGGNQLFLTNADIHYKYSSIKMRLDNLFNGNKILSDTIHHFLNENSELVLSRVRPGIRKRMNTFIERVFNSIFARLPADVLHLRQGIVS